MDEYKYANCIECNRELMKASMFTANEDFVCEPCIRTVSKFGRFEGHNDEELATAVILYNQMLRGDAVESMHQDGWGSVDTLGEYLLMIDDRGFVTFEDFVGHPDQLTKRWDELHDDGFGFSEDDFIIGEDGTVWQNGKKLNVYPPRHTDDISDTRRRAAIRLEMMRTGYYPNVWYETRNGVRIAKGI